MKRSNVTARGTAQAALLFVMLQVVVPAKADDLLPEFYGLYAIDQGRLLELSPSSNSPVLSSDVRFIYFGKNISTSADTIRLTRAYFIRNWVFPGATLQPNNKWTVIPESPGVVLRTKPVPSQPEMIYLVPREPLSSGAMYAVKLQDGGAISFAVDTVLSAEQVAQRDYCVDVSVGNPFHIAGGMYTLKNASTCAEVDCLLAGRPASSCTEQISAGSPTSSANSNATTGSQGPGASTGATSASSLDAGPLIGIWTGEARGWLPYDVVIEVRTDSNGGFVGRAEYYASVPARPLQCRTNIALSSVEDSVYTFRERITENRGSCPSAGLLRLTVGDPQTAQIELLSPKNMQKAKYKGKLRKAS